MAEYFATRVCDVCRRNVAAKEKLFYKTYLDYTRVRFKGRPQHAILCHDCYSDMVWDLQAKIEEETHANDHN